ncbi:hypothetical protein CBS101457_000750 [Exobasidium rhododendri]|nr:hypothetical protein CBS101457_000750 [Exobasidium rhododendri]
MQSPRRSPRISAESAKRQSPRVANKEAVNATSRIPVSRRSTGGLKAGQDNDPTTTPSKNKGKTSRRAQSVGGDRSQRVAREVDDTISVVPSRRNVPGPRKSAIRALPPQVFSSPVLVDTRSLIKTAASSATSFISKFVGAEVMELMGSMEAIDRSGFIGEGNPQLSRDKDATVADQTTVEREQTPPQNEEDNTVARKKRRVTFNPFQEKTAFHLEEPTIRIRPSGEIELVAESGNTTSNDGSADMSFDSSDDSDLQSEREEAEEVSMEMTFQEQDVTETLLSDDSAMDLTSVYGGMMNSTTLLLPSGPEDDDDDSDSEQEFSSDESAEADGVDKTMTMQFTTIYEGDLSESRLEQEGEEMAEMEDTGRGKEGVEEEAAGETEEEMEMEEEEEVDEEMDMQLTEVIDEGTQGPATDEEDSAMELTAVFGQSPDTATLTTRSMRRSTASSRHSDLRSSSPDKASHVLFRPRISTATHKEEEKRQSTSRSPVKPATHTPRKSHGGASLLTSSSTPFQSSSTPSQSFLSARRSLQTIPTTPTRSSSSHPRQSSPSRTPSSPSRAWGSFQSPKRPVRDTSESPKAKRIRVAVDNPTQGTPQRVPVSPVLSSPVEARQAVKAEKAEEEEGIGEEEEEVRTNWTWKEFFDHLDMAFLDLNAPSKREISQEGRKSVDNGDDTVQWSKAACAMIPYLESLAKICEELRLKVQQGRQWILEYEERFLRSPPLYVKEVTSMTNKEERQAAIQLFAIQRSSARAKALKEYYLWRIEKQFDDKVMMEWERARMKLKEDLNYINGKAQEIKGRVIPILSQRHGKLAEDVREEVERRASIEGCNEEEMEGLYQAMADQSVELNGQEASLAEAAIRLAEIEGQLEELAKKREAAKANCERAEAMTAAYENCTEPEAKRSAMYVAQIERLHLWTLQRATPREVVMELEQELILTLQLEELGVSAAQVVVREKTPWQKALQVAVDERLHSKQGEATSATDLVRFVTITWTKMRQLSTLYEDLLTRFPVQMKTFEADGKEKRAALLQVSVLLPKEKVKVVVELEVRMANLVGGDDDSSLLSRHDISASQIYGSKVDATAMAIRIADEFTGGNRAGNMTEAITTAQGMHD